MLWPDTTKVLVDAPVDDQASATTTKTAMGTVTTRWMVWNIKTNKVVTTGKARAEFSMRRAAVSANLSAGNVRTQILRQLTTRREWSTDSIPAPILRHQDAS